MHANNNVLKCLIFSIFQIYYTNSDIVIRNNIIGGKETVISNHPYLVSILYHRDYICCGAIISTKFILSAAHCFSENYHNPYSLQHYYEIRYDTTTLNGTDNLVLFKSVLNHPEYNKYYDNDISLIEIVKEFNFNELTMLKVIDLPENDFELPYNETAVVSGWGRIQFNGPLAKILQSVNVTILSDELCKGFYKTGISESMFCAGDIVNGGHDACVGDSGSPLVYQDNILIGIVSWGVDCGKSDFPGVYTDVRKFRSWIDEYI